MNEVKVSPRLSIVIAANNPGPVIATCLSALEKQHQGDSAEIIVVVSSTDGTDAVIRERFPNVRLLHFNEPLSVPQLRGKGIAMARGEIIAILDPYSIANDRWISEVLRTHDERPNLAIGGVVDLYDAEKQDFLAWAIYINEYGMFMSPVLTGVAAILPGSNISYKREALFDGNSSPPQDFWKTFANWDIESAGSGLWLTNRVVVSLLKPVPFGDFLRTRFLHGRCFAGMRVYNAPTRERLIRALTAPLLPGVFLWRWGRNYWAKGRYRSKFLLTLPLQLLLFGNWAIGEFFGYCFGPGQSCRKLYY